MTVRVMLSPVAAKRSLVRAFQAVVPDDTTIFLADSDLGAPALIGQSKVLQTPPWVSASWAEELVALCSLNQISLLVSLADREIIALAAIVKKLEEQGTKTLLPLGNRGAAGLSRARRAQDALNLCNDKRAFASWCEEQRFPIPKTFHIHGPGTGLGRSPFQIPLFARPAIGQGSTGAIAIDHDAMLNVVQQSTDRWIIQELVSDPEYSIDVLSSLEGQALQAVVRRRLITRGGESMTTQVVSNPELEGLALQVCDALGLVGHSVVQAFWSPKHGPRLIEVNPRFGGASTLSIRAGLNSPRRILGMVRGDSSAYRNSPIQIGLTMHRVAEDIFVDPPKK